MRLLAIAAAAALFGSACNCGGPEVNGSDGGESTLDDAGGNSGIDGGCLPLAGEGTPIVDGLQRARRLAADSTHLYVSEMRSPSLRDGRVLRVPLAGGLVEEVATDLDAPDAILAANGMVFVQADDGLWRIDATTPAFAKARIDATLNNALFGETNLLLDGEALVVATGHRRLLRVRTDGGGAQVLHEAALGSSVRGLAKVGDDVFFLVAEGAEPGLYRVPADGSGPATRVRDDLQVGHYVSIDGVRLIVSEGEAGGGRIVAVSLDGLVAEDLVTGLEQPGRVLPFGGALYFKDRTGAVSPDFFRVRASCGVFPVGPEGVGPGDLVEAGGVLFFTSEAPSGPGYLSRLP